MAPMKLRMFASTLLLVACGDDPATDTDTVTSATLGDTAAETAAPDDTATADDTSVEEETVATATTIEDAATETASPDDTTTTPEETADTSEPDVCTCVAATRTEVYADMPAGTGTLEVEVAGQVAATRDDVALAAGHVYALVHGGQVGDEIIAVHDEPFTDAPAGHGRLVFGHFADALETVTLTFGAKTANPVAPGGSARFAVADPTASIKVSAFTSAPGGQPGIVHVAPVDADLRTVVFGLSTLVAHADWAELDGGMAVRAYNHVGPELRLYLGCSAPAACAAEVAAGTAFDLGVSQQSSATSLERWRVVATGASVRLIGIDTVSGGTHTDTTVTLGSGTHHTLVYFLRADGQAVWQDFASNASDGPVLDVINAQAPFGLDFRFEPLIGTPLAAREFHARWAPVGMSVVSFYAGTPDLALATPFATSFPFAFDGRMGLVVVRDLGSGNFGLQDNGSAIGPGAGVRMLVGCALPGATACTFFASTAGEDCGGSCP